MTDLQEKNDIALASKEPEAIHTEESAESVASQVPFSTFLVGFLGICAADLMLGFIMYSDGSLSVAYVSAFNALSSYAILSTSSGIIQAIMPPVVTTCGDIIGYKKSYFIFLTLFILGCVLNGTAKDWNMFVGGSCVRTIGHQGLSLAGNIIIATSLPLRKRGLWSSVVNLVYLITVGVAPVIAGALIKRGDWRIVYYIYIPIGVLVVAPLILKLRVPQTTRAPWRERIRQVDFIGFAIVIAATVLITLPPIWGGVKYPWKSATIICCLVFGFLLYVLFYFYITKLSKVKNPVVETRLFRKTNMVWAIASQILQSAGLFGWMMYLTFYGGVVMGLDDTQRGHLQLPYVAFQALSGILEGLLLTKYGVYRPFLIIAPLFTIAGIAITYAYTESSPYMIYLSMGLAGFGAGSQYLSLVLSTQACHPSRDTAQAVMVFGFCVGIVGSLFSSITGATFNAVQTKYFTQYFPPGTPAETFAAAKFVLDTKTLDPAMASILKAAWTDIIRVMAGYGIGLVALGYICSWFIVPYKLSDRLGDEPERCTSKGIRGFLGFQSDDGKVSKQ
ncbi:MFS general substrate transporter [Basidiobolus meristosporus CBS 931.73]|uniref:MFS general substrate transporter n=1 Tax=Basidiobolus meristosporus CBS 931.73 TaxID=1314790 RepID=A0A1Y1WNX3_9FUNG|nr:MFS general substrate transporter [Basidiobolus meristosporus CBS 931.73]|eukprot:ORX75223.1 MFS general substrate transporter [Basidiobolus meristosporus CBS 931.73]